MGFRLWVSRWALNLCRLFGSLWVQAFRLRHLGSGGTEFSVWGGLGGVEAFPVKAQSTSSPV